MPERTEYHEVSRPAAERRLYPRARVSTVAYLYLNDGQDCRIKDISEGGLAVEAQALGDQSFEKIRFRLPNYQTYIDCCARTIWFAKSKSVTQTGIQFVDLAESARSEIRNWIASQASKSERAGLFARSEEVSATANSAGRAPNHGYAFNFDTFFPAESTLTVDRSPEPSVSQDFSNPLYTGPAASSADSLDAPAGLPNALNCLEIAPSAREPLSDSMAVLNVKAPEIAGANSLESAAPELLPAFAAAEKPVRENSAAHAGTESDSQKEPSAPPEHQPEHQDVPLVKSNVSVTREGDRSVRAPTYARSKKRTALPVLTATVGFLAGLSVAAFLIFGPFNFVKSASNGQVHTEDVSIPVTHASSPPRSAKPDQVSSQSNAPATAELSEPPSRPLQTPEAVDPSNRTTESRIPQTATPVRTGSSQPIDSNVLTDPTAKSALPAGKVTLEKKTAIVKTSEQQPAPGELSNPSSAGTLPGEKTQESKISGSVANTSQFIAVHMPQQLDSAKSELSGVLEIGQLVSSRNPDYPTAAAQAGIEGTVKLHATVGINGSVQRIEPVSGPSALIPAAMLAVHDWMYEATMIAGKPVESEHNITFVFRLTE